MAVVTDTAYRDVLRAGPSPARSKYPPLIFIHGAFAGAWTWAEHFLGHFADLGFSCHAVNLPGRKGGPDHGRLHDYGIKDFARAVIDVIDDLPAAPVLIGHSMGGFIAQRAALERAAAGTVLMSSVPPTGLVGPSVALAMAKPMLTWEIACIQTMGESVATLNTLHQSIFNDHVPEEVTARLMPRFQMESRRAVMDMHAVMVPPLSGFMGKPVLVLGAERDNLIPPAFVHGTAAFLGTNAYIFDGMGHAVMLEADWRKAAETVSDWLGEVYG
ncbi:MAG: alpha/beta fold hydrolase [Rhodospirillaceae bacterium]